MSIYLEPTQFEALKAYAAETKVPMSEFVRQALDRSLALLPEDSKARLVRFRKPTLRQAGRE